MNRVLSILFFLGMLYCPVYGIVELVEPTDSDSLVVPVDSIVRKVISMAPFHESLVDEFRAEVYIKSQLYIRKKNILVRFIPSMIKPKKGQRDYLLELYSDLHYTAPNIYDQKIKAVSGTIDRFRSSETEILDYFKVNIYSSSLVRSKLLSPLSGEAPRYYSYKVDSLIKYKGEDAYRISFTPRNVSYQLVEGYMIVSDKAWSVREMQFSGRSEYMRYVCKLEMGDTHTDSKFLPVRFDMNITFKFFGNVIDGNLVANLDYESIRLNESVMAMEKGKRQERGYNLTESFTLQTDTTSFTTDTACFARHRPIPLSDLEIDMYKKYYHSKDTTLSNIKFKTQAQIFWGEVGDMMISNYNINVPEVGTVRASALLNPFLMSYSGSRGVSYKQQFKYGRLFAGDRLLRVTPRFGYNFKYKEFYWSVDSDFDYWPSKRSALHLRFGNGNRIHSSDVIDELKEIPDSVFDFNKIHLDYFRDLYLELLHSTEITNGLTFDLGFSVHRRKTVQNSEFVPIGDAEGVPGLSAIYPDFSDKFRNSYLSTAPRLRLTWTPGQYYYMSGKRKVNLHSWFPTFSLDWERAISGIFGSTGKYERMEFDVQHSIPLGLMRSLYYRVGAGAFTNQEQLYFVDFANFTKNNLPVGWNDEIGGVFQLLDRRWYNSSRKYLRGHVTYEAPFLLMPRLGKLTRYILNERIYVNALMMPRLNPYIEVGYGIGTHIFDVGVFVGNTNGKFNQFGFEFTFELFNR